MAAISNFQIENTIKNIGDNDLIDNFVGVFLSNYMNKFIDHASIISDKGKYPFIIANTDRSEKQGVDDDCWVLTSYVIVIMYLISFLRLHNSI